MKIISPANIALVKHWGMKSLSLPYSNSLSFNLDKCHTTVEIEKSIKDEIVIITEEGNSNHITEKSTGRDLVLWQHIQNLKEKLQIQDGIKINSQNSFPMKVGIASSASGFSAITSSLVLFAEKNEIFEDKKTLAKMVAQAGSISACRSVIDSACLLTIKDEINVKPVNINSNLKLVDIVAVVDNQPKEIGSGEGQILSKTSPHFMERIELANKQAHLVAKGLEEGDWKTIRSITIEQSKILHKVVETSEPKFQYIQNSVKALLKKLAKNSDQLSYAITFDAGTIPHIITTEDKVAEIEKFLATQSIVQDILVNRPCLGSRLV